jgi:hypothetical protein
MASIEALSPVFSADPQQNCFCVTVQGQRNLLALGARLAGSRDLVGLYVTESAEPDYQPDAAQYGRVVALVRMLPMPSNHTIHNYLSGCVELRGGQLVDRWPIGWPSETVFFSPHGGPVLRDAVSSALHIHDYAGFAGQFLQGPIDIRRMPALRNTLMTEVLHQIAHNPGTQLRPF